MHAVRGVCAGLALIGASVAQAAFVVDAANGPGTDFTSLDVATATVPSGSTLLVRAGSYGPAQIVAKAMTVLCEPGVWVMPSVQGGQAFSVANTTAGQTVCVLDLLLLMGRIRVSSASGPVVFRGTQSQAQMMGMEVAASRRVFVSGYGIGTGWSPSAPTTFHAGLDLSANAVVVLESCTVAGMHSYFLTSSPATAGIVVGSDGSACTAQLSNTSVLGGFGTTNPYTLATTQGASAIEVSTNSQVRMTGSFPGTSFGLQGGTNGGGIGSQPAIVGTGPVRIDPAVAISPPLGPSPTITRPVMPGLTTSGGAIGGSITVERTGAAAIPIAIAIGFSVPPTTWPGSPDPLWLDPSASFIEAFTMAATSPFSLVKQVPGDPALRGLVVYWQAVDFQPTGAMPLSNPSACLLR